MAQDLASWSQEACALLPMCLPDGLPARARAERGFRVPEVQVGSAGGALPMKDKRRGKAGSVTRRTSSIHAYPFFTQSHS